MSTTAQQRSLQRERERSQRERQVTNGPISSALGSLFGEPIKRQQEDETTKRIKSTLGDFDTVQLYLTNNHKPLIGISTREITRINGNKAKMEQIFSEMKQTFPPLSELDGSDEDSERLSLSPISEEDKNHKNHINQQSSSSSSSSSGSSSSSLSSSEEEEAKEGDKAVKSPSQEIATWNLTNFMDKKVNSFVNSEDDNIRDVIDRVARGDFEEPLKKKRKIERKVLIKDREQSFTKISRFEYENEDKKNFIITSKEEPTEIKNIKKENDRKEVNRKDGNKKSPRVKDWDENSENIPKELLVSIELVLLRRKPRKDKCKNEEKKKDKIKEDKKTDEKRKRSPRKDKSPKREKSPRTYKLSPRIEKSIKKEIISPKRSYKEIRMRSPRKEQSPKRDKSPKRLQNDINSPFRRDRSPKKEKVFHALPLPSAKPKDITTNCKDNVRIHSFYRDKLSEKIKKSDKSPERTIERNINRERSSEFVPVPVPVPVPVRTKMEPFSPPRSPGPSRSPVHSPVTVSKSSPRSRSPAPRSPKSSPNRNRITGFNSLLPNSNEDLMCPDDYLSAATTLKHEADRESDRTVQARKYLEAVLYFILTGNAIEQRSGDSEKVCVMYKETLILIRYISGKFVKSRMGSKEIPTTDHKLTALSCRCQALLNLKLWRLKEKEIKGNFKVISVFHRSIQGNMPKITMPSTHYATMYRQINLLQLLSNAHELWAQADALLERYSACRAFFEAVDNECGVLSLSSSFDHLVHYVKTGLKILE